MTPGTGGIGLTEPVKHMGQKTRIDALSSIGNLHLQVGVDARERHRDSAVFGRELHGVRHQVPEHLLHPVGIAADRTGHRIQHYVQTDTLRLGSWLYRFDGRVDG